CATHTTTHLCVAMCVEMRSDYLERGPGGFSWPLGLFSQAPVSRSRFLQEPTSNLDSAASSFAASVMVSGSLSPHRSKRTWTNSLPDNLRTGAAGGFGSGAGADSRAALSSSHRLCSANGSNWAKGSSRLRSIWADSSGVAGLPLKHLAG